MNILVVTPQLPDPPAWGFAIRVYQLVRYLSEHHDVTLLAYRLPHESTDGSSLSRRCTLLTVRAPAGLGPQKRRAQLASLASTHSYRRSSLYSVEMARAINTLMKTKAYDVVQVESSPMAWFDAGQSALVIDEHNIESELLHRMHGAERSAWRRLYNWIEFVKLRGEEREAWHRSAGIVLTSERDMVTARAAAPLAATSVVPNSVDAEYFRPGDDAADGRNLVFIGALNYRPNVDGVLFFAREILPRIREDHPSAHFTIVGGSAPSEVEALRGNGVTLTGRVTDIRPYLRAASVVVVPLRMGGGTRLKLLEGLAMGKAVVSTAMGAEGLMVNDGEHLLIADDAAGFASRVSRLMGDPELRRSLGHRGRALIEREYTWEAAGQRLEAFYGRLLGRARRVA